MSVFKCLTKVIPLDTFGMLCLCIVSLPNDNPTPSFPKLSSSPAFHPLLPFSILPLSTFASSFPLPLSWIISFSSLSIPVSIYSPRLLFSPGLLVSQDALFQTAPLGPSSMGGAWAGRENTDWTLPLRTGTLADHPPSASDGRGRWEPQNQPHLPARLRHWR